MVKEDERLTFLQSIFCGGIAGVLSRTLTSPLEVVKVLAQVGTPESRVGFFRSFNRIYRSEGLKAFWKGNGISCLRLVPYSAIQLAAYHNLLVRVVQLFLRVRIQNSVFEGRCKQSNGILIHNCAQSTFGG